MPTGFTADIANDISFEQFVMTCTRAFGACVTLRDTPMDVPIPEFEVSDYHTKEIDKLKDRLQQLMNMSLSVAQEQATLEWEASRKSYQKATEDRAALLNKYQKMLKKVQSWSPPTSDHYRLKDFMIEQISNSIEFDCGPLYYSLPDKPMTGDDWLKKESIQISKSTKYHIRERDKEIALIKGRNEWVRTLRASLVSVASP